MTERMSLQRRVAEIVRKYEDGQNHDAGAFDQDCETCRILADLRQAIGEIRNSTQENRDGK